MTVAELPLIPVPAAPAGQPPTRITVDRFAGPCGAVVGGVDLAGDLDDITIAEIRRALLDHGVIFFRGQSLTPDQQVAFSRRFGPYSPVPFVQPIAEHDEVIAVVREPTERQGFAFGGIWHSDFSILPEPPMGSILHALEVPPFGGDTLWANQYLAFETLSPGLQRTARGLAGVHSARDAYSPKMQAIHDQFEGMTVQTSEDANRVQVHPGGPRPRGERARGAVPQPAVHDRARRLVAARGEGPPRPLLPALDPAVVHVPVAVAGRRRRVLGQPLRAAHGHGRRRRLPARDAPHHGRR